MLLWFPNHDGEHPLRNLLPPYRHLHLRAQATAVPLQRDRQHPLHP